MKYAYPINKQGEQSGGIQSFSDSHWEAMLKIPNLRWKLVDMAKEPKKNIKIKTVKPKKVKKDDSTERSK